MLAIHITVILNDKLWCCSNMFVSIGYIEEKHEKHSCLSSTFYCYSVEWWLFLIGLLRVAAGHRKLIRSERDGGVNQHLLGSKVPQKQPVMTAEVTRQRRAWKLLHMCTCLSGYWFRVKRSNLFQSLTTDHWSLCLKSWWTITASRSLSSSCGSFA